jgi:hypothetical protein
VAEATQSISDALSAIGHPGPAPPRRPVLRHGSATLITLATLGADGAATWHGLWIDPKGARGVGPTPPRSAVASGTTLAPSTTALIDLLEAASGSYVERLEGIGSRLDVLEARPDPAPLPELASLLHALAGVHQHIGRLTVLVAQLEGALGTQFPGLADSLAVLRGTAAHVDGFCAGLAQAVRDLVAIRNAVEANQLAEAANRLAGQSNRIAALANTSNLRMLGVAYIALVLALISAVVLIPNTAATILGIPGAAWVPGIWIVVILVVLSVVPIVVVFSRPWVLQTLRGLPGSERRTEEGVSDLPEVRAQDVNRDASLLRQGP